MKKYKTNTLIDSIVFNWEEVFSGNLERLKSGISEKVFDLESVSTYWIIKDPQDSKTIYEVILDDDNNFYILRPIYESLSFFSGLYKSGRKLISNKIIPVSCLFFWCKTSTIKAYGWKLYESLSDLIKHNPHIPEITKKKINQNKKSYQYYSKRYGSDDFRAFMRSHEVEKYIKTKKMLEEA